MYYTVFKIIQFQLSTQTISVWKLIFDFEMYLGIASNALYIYRYLPIYFMSKNLAIIYILYPSIQITCLYITLYLYIYIMLRARYIY